MAEMRMVISCKGKSNQIILTAEQVTKVKGLKLGAKLKGDDFGLAGYELVIRGGTDKDGFPLRNDVHGAVRKQIILTGGTGYKPKEAGVRKRKTVKGGTIDADVAQVNVMVTKEGTKKFDVIFAKPAEEKKE